MMVEHDLIEVNQSKQQHCVSRIITTSTSVRRNNAKGHSNC